MSWWTSNWPYSTLGMTMLSLAVKIPSCTRFPKMAAGPSISLLTWSAISPSLTCLWPRWFLNDVASLKTLAKLLFWVYSAFSLAIADWFPWPKTKSFAVPFIWLRNFFILVLLLASRKHTVRVIEICSIHKTNRLQQNKQKYWIIELLRVFSLKRRTVL